MNVIDFNARISVEVPASPDFLPHLAELNRGGVRFAIDFGLNRLPEEPGILLIRGARQYGKSTWLELMLWETLKTYGPGSAFYLNGDDIGDDEELAQCMLELAPMFAKKAGVRRLFIDEITAVNNWQRALKRLMDRGLLRDVLVVTAGSRAADLRHGSERLPGRKGKLARTAYLFVPVSYKEFFRVAEPVLGKTCLDAYILTGGSPIACAEILQGRIPEYVVEIVKDWILGEFSRAGRSRTYLMAVMRHLLKRGGSPVAQANLARETGMANNTVAAGYIEMLCDLLCLARSYAWDASKRIPLPRRPCKLPFCNTLVALAWCAQPMRAVPDFQNAPPELRAAWTEWIVAQELWRRAAIAGHEFPEELLHWNDGNHEIDFVLSAHQFIEVKIGKTTPIEFSWFPKVFPRGRLQVINRSRYETDAVKGITLEDFLLAEE